MIGAAPATASARRYLRDGLPAIYREDDLGMQLVAALEEVLDPIVALLDGVHHYIDPRLAPMDLVLLLAVWLGAENEDAPREQQRDIVSQTPTLWRLRGTRAGLELTLRLSFPELLLTVLDLGGVTWSMDGPFTPARTPGFEVVCHSPLTAERREALERVIERNKPAHVPHEVVLRASTRPGWGSDR